MATHSSVCAWRMPWTEEPGGLQSRGSHSQTWRKQLSMQHACKVYMFVNFVREETEAQRGAGKIEQGAAELTPRCRSLWAQPVVSSLVCCPSCVTLCLTAQHGCDHICINPGATSMSPLSFYLFFNVLFWLCWVFIATRGPSLVAVSGGHSSLWVTGFS